MFTANVMCLCNSSQISNMDLSSLQVVCNNLQYAVSKLFDVLVVVFV